MSPKSEDAGLGGLSAAIVRGGTVVSDSGSQKNDVLILGNRIAHIAPDIADVDIPGVPVEIIDGGGKLVMPALVDHHCHPTGGGGGGGPQTQNLPLLLEDFTTAGVGTFIGCLGHDTAVRRPEALLSRVRALRSLGLRGHMFTGEIVCPPVTLTGSIDRDLFLFDEVRGLKSSVGEVGSLRTIDDIAEVASLVTRGSRTAGKPANIHLHVGPRADSLALIESAVSANVIAPSMITLTHVNWNRDVLDAAIGLAGMGVNVDVTACIRPDYFRGSIEPADAVAELCARCPDDFQVSVSSDAGGSHATDSGLVGHAPGLLLRTFRMCLAAGDIPAHRLATVFAASTTRRLGLPEVGTVAVRSLADLILLRPDGEGPISLILNGREVVRRGEALYPDPIGSSR